MKLILPIELVFPLLSVYPLQYCMSLLTKEVLLASLKRFTARSSCTAAIARSEDLVLSTKGSFKQHMSEMLPFALCRLASVDSQGWWSCPMENCSVDKASK